MDENKKAGKRCRRCNHLMPLDAFVTPRTRECMECQVKRREKGVRALSAGLKPTTEIAPGERLFDTREGRAAYYRLRKRGLQTKKPDPIVLPKYKLCRSCQRMKPLEAFGSWRVRLCLECDGPMLRDLITAGVK